MENLIIKYLTDNISETEQQELIQWLQVVDNQNKFKEIVKINYRLNKQYSQMDTDQAYETLLKHISSNKTKTSLNSRLLPNLFKYAAVFAGLAILGYSIYSNSPRRVDSHVDTPQITLQLEDGSIQVVDENATTAILDSKGNLISQQKNNQLFYSKKENSEKLVYNTLSVPYGKSFKLELSDGSLVTLNAGTKLKYPISFIEDNDRTVFLDGEAYFEVAKDEAHTFVVNTSDMDVEVLGTKFNVSSYIEDDKTSTVLVEGKVQAYNKIFPENTVILNPNQKASFDENTLLVEDVKVDKYIAWIQGQLIFKDDSFKVITNKLERKFNLKIINNYSELENIIVTASFSSETIEQVLETFQTYKDFDYSIKNGIITINKPN